MKSTVSVVIPAYNAEKTVESAIASVLEQTVSPLEILVIDDRSRDGTAGILQRLEKTDSRIRLIRNEVNQGVSFSRNRGVKEASGDFVAFLDSDDVWLPHKLEKQLLAVENAPDTDMIYTAYGYMTAEGHPFRYVFSVPSHTDVNGMLRKNVMSTSGLMIRRSLLLEHPFRSDVAHEDLYEWITLLRAGAKCRGLREKLHMVRLTGRGSRSGVKTRAAADRMRLYEELGITGGKKLFYWGCYAVSALIKYVSMRLLGVDGSEVIG